MCAEVCLEIKLFDHFLNNLVGETYLDLFYDAIDPGIRNVIEDKNNNHQPYLEDPIIFHRDGASLHYAVAVREYLNKTNPARWIG